VYRLGYQYSHGDTSNKNSPSSEQNVKEDEPLLVVPPQFAMTLPSRPLKVPCGAAGTLAL
jgi:hypothetical protein